jgi:hypothetical protein
MLVLLPVLLLVLSHILMVLLAHSENDPCYYSPSSYDSLSATPTDSDLLTPQSVTSSYRNHDSPIIEGVTAESAHHGIHVGSPRPTDWDLNPYFGSVVLAQDTNGYPPI